MYCLNLNQMYLFSILIFFSINILAEVNAYIQIFYLTVQQLSDLVVIYVEKKKIKRKKREISQCFYVNVEIYIFIFSTRSVSKIQYFSVQAHSISICILPMGKVVLSGNKKVYPDKGIVKDTRNRNQTLDKDEQQQIKHLN